LGIGVVQVGVEVGVEGGVEGGAEAEAGAGSGARADAEAGAGAWAWAILTGVYHTHVIGTKQYTDKSSAVTCDQQSHFGCVATL